MIYRVRNDGPQDLDSVTIHRPRPPDRITYPIAVTGGGAGWATDEVTLGPPATKEEPDRAAAVQRRNCPTSSSA